MSENKTKLQTLTTPENRQIIFIMLRDGKTVDDIAFLFKGEGGKEKTLSILEAALLPEKFENLPLFDTKTRIFSDVGFENHLSFLNEKIASDEFTDKELESLTEKGIARYWQLLSSEDLSELKEPLENYFSFPVVLPVIFTDEQRAKLIE